MNRPAKSVLIVRTNVADELALAAFDRYSGQSGLPTVFCCDETSAAVDVGRREKTGFSASDLASARLAISERVGWLCGDYFYYFAREKFAAFDYYWLIEPDVHLHTNDVAGFFSKFALRSEDLLAPRFGRQEPTWSYHRAAIDIYAVAYGCLFTITRLSSRAIDHLRGKRIALAKPLALNDEAFVCSELANDGEFVCGDLNRGDEVFWSSQTLRWRPPHEPSRIKTLPYDGMIYHPVREPI